MVSEITKRSVTNNPPPYIYNINKSNLSFTSDTMSVSITNDKAKKLSPSPITFHKVKRNTKYECANYNKKQMNLRQLKIHVMGTAETSCFVKIKEPKQTKCKSSEVRPKIKYLIYNKSSMKLVCSLCFNAARKNNDTPPISHTVLGVMGFYQYLIGNGKKDQLVRNSLIGKRIENLI